MVSSTLSAPARKKAESDSCRGQVQCSGLAKTTGTRCRRKLDSKCLTAEGKAYCHQHRHQAPVAVAAAAQASTGIVGKRKPSGSLEREKHHKSNGILDFWQKLFCGSRHDRYDDQKQARNLNRQQPALYNPVSSAVRAKYVRLLAEEFKKPISQADGSGYIYIYELATARSRDSLHPDTVLFLKIGRAKDVSKRIEQWALQCSHAVILTGHFPSPASSNPPNQREKARAKCGAIHRAERLIHLELRAMFPCSADDPSALPVTSETKMLASNGMCGFCGKRHTEWFAVRKRDAHIVVRIISKWIEYVGIVHEM